LSCVHSLQLRKFWTRAGPKGFLNATGRHPDCVRRVITSATLKGNPKATRMRLLCVSSAFPVRFWRARNGTWEPLRCALQGMTSRCRRCVVAASRAVFARKDAYGRLTTRDASDELARHPAMRIASRTTEENYKKNPSEIPVLRELSVSRPCGLFRGAAAAADRPCAHALRNRANRSSACGRRSGIRSPRGRRSASGTCGR